MFDIMMRTMAFHFFSNDTYPSLLNYQADDLYDNVDASKLNLKRVVFRAIILNTSSL